MLFGWFHRQLRCVVHATRVGETRNSYKVLARKPQLTRPLEGSKHTREDNIKMDLRETECEGLNCTEVLSMGLNGVGFCEHGN
jgi:hypothetical protein